MVVSTAIEIRRLNKERIRSAIQQHDKCTKADIARETALSMATCSTTLNEMLEVGEILKVDQTGFNIGRPADLFAYNRDYLHVLGLCTAVRGGQYVLAYAIADAYGNVITREEQRVETLDYDRLEKVVAACTAQDPLIRAVGLGIPGHAQNGCIEACSIKTLEGIDFARRIQQKHEVEVLVENDMNFIAYRLFHESPEHSGNFAAIYFPQAQDGYVGCGLIVDGHLLKGSSMLAGELSQVARAFGVGYEQQREILQDREAFRRFVAQMIVLVACTVSPARLTIMGNDLNADDLQVIYNRCREVIADPNIPQISINNQVFDNYIEGLVRFTLDSMLYPISIS
ncbi:MAG: ROK family protein [Butyricicoccus sp.]|nr:ROK family protein [Butyricicoccus sp.]